MPEVLPLLLVPGLNCSARLFGEQIPALWRLGPVTVADHTRDETMPAIAERILASSPPRFALIGLSMGGYIAFEMLRRAPGRVSRLALLDTSARADRPDQSALRDGRISLTLSGRYAQVCEEQFPLVVHPERRNDAVLRQLVLTMNAEVGPEAYVRQQRAIKGRPDSRPGLAAIRCPTVVLVGDSDASTPPDLAREIAAGIPGSHLVVIPQCGHLSTLERPEAVNQALTDWLDMS
jgi:pimeloyl-ACP methyl ester carboxylesterase